MSDRAMAHLKTACGLVAALIGLVTVAGWLSGARLLSGLRVDYIPMAPNTAIGFLLLGIALAAMPSTSGGARWHKIAAAGASAFVAILSALKLAEYAFDVDLRVHAWFMEVPSERFGLAPVGKMALSTAITFQVASLAGLLRATSSRRLAADCAGVGGLAVLGSGLVFSLGYLYAAPLFYGGRTIPMALNTALAFCLVGTGLIAAAGPAALPLRPLSGPSVQARLLRAFLPFTLAVVLVSDWLTQAVAWLAAPSSMALATAAALVIAIVIAAALCAAFAGRIGGQLDRAEAELRQANELLESRVLDRTRDLREAKQMLEERNLQLQESAAELERKAESVRRAHLELQAAHEELKRAEAQLVQSERLSSLGQVVAGVAHEINNPLAFVTNNVAVLQRDVGQLNELIRLYQQAERTLEQHQHELMTHIRGLAEQMDLAYVLEMVPTLMARSREGLKRIQQIVKDLRDFARLDEAELKETDLNEGVTATLRLLQPQAAERGVALVEALSPLPVVTCYPAKINQVLLNLVANAIDACDRHGTVSVQTAATGEGGVLFQVADTGCGIDPSIRGKIFEPFFTTKPIGQGTGLGLAISYGVIQSHGGTIEVESTPGHGSRFTVRLPSRPQPAAGDAVVFAHEMRPGSNQRLRT
jgi:signal transduction histidine kinase